MMRGVFATVDHRKLMELKNSGAVDAKLATVSAQIEFLKLRREIKLAREGSRKKGFFSWLFDVTLPIDKQVDLMFPTRAELVNHLLAVSTPSPLCPITEKQRERMLFLDKAAAYCLEAEVILGMFKRHHEIIVDRDTSEVVEWIIQNQKNLRSLKEV